jgi:hypothetical protein
VGDKYGNPVKTETVVYFTTTGGIIGGSALTNAQGQASVNLMSAEPKPEHEILGKGFATVTGRTVDENQNQIEAYAIVLFSGIPSISVSPASIDVANGGSQSFFYQVMDQNGNPLAAGTNISVSVADGDIKAVGNTGIELPDTQSPSWTQFGFSLSDAKPDSIAPNFASVKIRVSGPNGKAETAIFGTAR